MGIRDSIGNLGATGAASTNPATNAGAAVWERFSGRSAAEKRADRETAVAQTLASSSNPTLLHEHLETKGW